MVSRPPIFTRNCEPNSQHSSSHFIISIVHKFRYNTSIKYPPPPRYEKRSSRVRRCSSRGALSSFAQLFDDQLYHVKIVYIFIEFLSLGKQWREIEIEKVYNIENYNLKCNERIYIYIYFELFFLYYLLFLYYLSIKFSKRWWIMIQFSINKSDKYSNISHHQYISSVCETIVI